MLILLIFAFISGLVTILAPCIWPLLPIVLSASSTGGRRKPLGITLGIIISFAIFTLTISYLVRLVKIDPDVFRYLAVGIIGFLGLSLVIPSLSARLEVLVSKLSGRFGAGQNAPARNGFWGGLLTGFSLGVVWSPCAGPILATIATLSVTTAVNLQVVLVTVVYVAGVGIPLFILSRVSNVVFTKTKALNKYTGRIQQIFGIVMILTAIAIYSNFDKALQVRLLDAFPSYSKYLIMLESNPEVQKQLDSISGGRKIQERVGKPMGAGGGSLADYGPAPEFVGINRWLNPSTGSGQAITMKSLRGKIVLVDFWTYTCINCIRTLPYVTSWYDKYRDAGLVVVGVHTPEFEFEKKTENVEMAIKQFGIHYPVAQDNNFGTWNAYSNRYWPAKYLIDSQGHLRYTHFGEGSYEETEMAIRELLEEAGAELGEEMAVDKIPEQTPKDRISPETYLGARRMEYLFPQGSVGMGEREFEEAAVLPVNSFSFGGKWMVGEEESLAISNSTLTYHFDAKNVFLVMRPTGGKASRVRVFIDGKPLTKGREIKDGIISVNSDRTYTLIELAKTEEHILKLEFADGGVSVYAFTFG